MAAKTVAVVGGGISGLATAYYVATRAARPVHVHVLEAAGRWGGWIESSVQVCG
jgi:protoporphyrinogen/coproporphyrinogen III oxidase